MSSISTTVQYNCHVADARYAGEYSLCIYLMKMREFYRWEKGYDFGVTLPKKELGDWLRQRESLWDDLEPEDYAPIPIDDELLDPFATDEINARILNSGLVYSGGLGVAAKPHFFLADLARHEQRFGYDVYVSEKEYARDLSAYPAMSQGQSIFLRRESIRRMVWEKLEEWRWNQPDNAMKRALAGYDFDQDLHHALDAMTDDVMEVMLLHEIGEIMAGEQLSQVWHNLISGLQRSKLELYLRAIRDHLADSLCTLPQLLKLKPKHLIHFFMATLSGIRKQLSPRLDQAYQHWMATGKLEKLYRYSVDSPQHWLKLANRICERYETSGLPSDPAWVDEFVAQSIY